MTGFFTKDLEDMDDLTIIPGDPKLVKEKKPGKVYNCNDCGRCLDQGGNFTKNIPVYGNGDKKILIVVDEPTEGAVEAKLPLVGTEKKLLQVVLKGIGLSLEKDIWLVNAIQGHNPDRKTSGMAAKACQSRLHNLIYELKPKVVMVSGFRAVQTLWSGRLSITDKWQRWVGVDKNMATPDQLFPGTWVIPTLATSDFIWSLKNELSKARKWIRGYESKGEPVPPYLLKKVDPEVSIVENKLLRNDDFNLKMRWFVRDLRSAIYHLNKEAPIDDSEENVEILKNKHDIYNAIQYFKGQKVVACDIETNTITPHREKAEIICISFSNIKRTISYMTRDPEVVEWTKSLLTTRSVQYIFHNATFEIKQFKMLWDIMVDNLFVDSQILSHCFDSRAQTSSLKFNAMRFLGIAEYEEQAKKFFKVAPEDKGTIYEDSNQSYNCLPLGLENHKLYEQGLLYPLDGPPKVVKEENRRRKAILKQGHISEDELLLYCGMDTILTCKITNMIKKRLMDEREWEAVKFYSKSSITLTKISMNGVKVDRAKLLQNMSILEKEAQEMHLKILDSPEAKSWTKYVREERKRLESFDPKTVKKELDALKDKDILNYNSGPQIGKLLFDILKIPGGKKTSAGNYTTSEAVLENIDSEMCKLIIARRKLLKAKKTYLGGILKELNDDDIAMPSYSLALVASFRSSCFSFNFQNQIKHDERMKTMIRECIIPHNSEYYAEADYSSCEAYAASIVSGDKVYFKYNTDKSADIHKFVAFTLFGLNDIQLPTHMLDGKEIKPSEKLFGKLRQISKTYTFASSYGGGYHNIAEDMWEQLLTLKEEEKEWVSCQLKSIGIVTKEAFRDQVKLVDSTVWGPTMFFKYAQFKKEQYNTYKKQGYLRNECGFVYRDLMTSMACANYPIQSIAFMKLMHGLNLIQEEIEKRGLKTKIIGEIHDSCVLSMPAEEMEIMKKILVQSMIHGTKNNPMFSWVNMDFKVDLDVYKSSWGSECKAIRLDPSNYLEDYITA